MFPPLLMARIGESFSDMRNSDALEESEQYAGNLENDLTEWKEYARKWEQYSNHQREEYDLVMKYIGELKNLYLDMLLDASDKFGVKYPLPTSGIVSWLGARVTRLAFFESAFGELPPVEQRVYNTAFPKSSTRMITLVMEFVCVPPRQHIDFVSTFNWYSFEQHDDIFSAEIKGMVTPDITSQGFTSSYGYHDAGKWAEGKYAVNIHAGNEFCAQAIFEILPDSR